MEKIRSFLGMSVLLTGIALAPVAQANTAALSEAKARLACGTGKAIGADVRPDGSIKVTCQQSGKGSRAGGGLGGGLSTEAVVGAVVLIVILGAILNDRGSDDTPQPINESNF